MYSLVDMYSLLIIFTRLARYSGITCVYCVPVYVLGSTCPIYISTRHSAGLGYYMHNRTGKVYSVVY